LDGENPTSEYARMKAVLKRWIVGSRLEPLARKVHEALGLGHGASKLSREYDAQTLEVMKRVLRQDSNSVDVGCHQGAILRDILRIAPGGTHLAFEPLPAMYQELVRAFGGRPNVRLYEIALSDATGSATFQHVVSDPAFSGLRKRQYARAEEQVNEIVVRTDLLDRIVPPELPIHFIKVDVEGAELQVFRGAVETMRRHRPVVVFEHGLGGADYFGTAPEQVYDLLVEQCRLRLHLMSNWLADASAPPLSREEFREQFLTHKNYYFMASAG
jgi:FkbM family methyltransferase